jgi:uncharacterized protein YndB with AHSA1/START domain
MAGKIHSFHAGVGGGYSMSLFYPPEERSFRGKTSEREDRVNVRFVELDPGKRIVEAFSFDTENPALFGEMRMVATFERMSGGTNVTLLFTDLPAGLRPEDNDEGARLSLSQLAQRFER